MFLRYHSIIPKTLVGKNLQMSIAQNKSFELWSRFMPHKKLITNTNNENLYSLQIYQNIADPYNIHALFTKWAACEVSQISNIPEDMQVLQIPAGDYAVFLHKGTPADFMHTAKFIYGEWLPASKYVLDQRPFFELLDERYKHNDPNSQEEVWIPIKAK